MCLIVFIMGFDLAGGANDFTVKRVCRTLLQLNGAQRLGSAELSKLRSERNRLIREYIEQHPEGE